MMLHVHMVNESWYCDMKICIPMSLWKKTALAPDEVILTNGCHMAAELLGDVVAQHPLALYEIFI